MKRCPRDELGGTSQMLKCRRAIQKTELWGSYEVTYICLGSLSGVRRNRERGGGVHAEYEVGVSYSHVNSANYDYSERATAARDILNTT